MPSAFDAFQTGGGFETGTRALPVAPETTGRLLVVLRKDQMRAELSALSDRAGLDLSRVASTADFAAEAGITGETLATTPMVMFEHLGVAVSARTRTSSRP
jgi:hypothetical protein